MIISDAELMGGHCSVAALQLPNLVTPTIQATGGSGKHCAVVPGLPFNEIWCADFEFRADRGERPWPVCMVARELKSGHELRLWRDDLLTLNKAPFDTSRDALFVGYFASAELGCFLELGWPLPANVLDLYVEHRVDTNGIPTPCGDGIVGALALRGLAHIDAGEKDSMRRLICDQRQWSHEEQRAILDYCASDVQGLAALLRKMTPAIDWPRALLRGRYMRRDHSRGGARTPRIAPQNVSAILEVDGGLRGTSFYHERNADGVRLAPSDWSRA